MYDEFVEKYDKYTKKDLIKIIQEKLSDTNLSIKKSTNEKKNLIDLAAGIGIFGVRDTDINEYKYYLTNDKKETNLTIASIKSILDQRGIKYKKSTKKAELLQLLSKKKKHVQQKDDKQHRASKKTSEATDIFSLIWTGRERFVRDYGLPTLINKYNKLYENLEDFEKELKVVTHV